jgi:hypothetical protein
MDPILLFFKRLEAPSSTDNHYPHYQFSKNQYCGSLPYLQSCPKFQPALQILLHLYYEFRKLLLQQAMLLQRQLYRKCPIKFVTFHYSLMQCYNTLHFRSSFG